MLENQTDRPLSNFRGKPLRCVLHDSILSKNGVSGNPGAVQDGWPSKAWLVTGEVAADNFDDAYRSFWIPVDRISARVGFVSQCYTEHRVQPMLVSRDDLQLAFFKYVRPRGSVPLMFTEKGQKAVERLLQSGVPEAFFHYWADAVNAYGFSAKLLLMFAALEALTKKENGETDVSKRVTVLGQELATTVFVGRKALRHRLSHGQYFDKPDSGVNYVDIIHKAVIDYFNREILREPLLHTNVVNPQRHFFGNSEQWRGLIRPKENVPLTLKAALEAFSRHRGIHSEQHEIIIDSDIAASFYGS